MRHGIYERRTPATGRNVKRGAPRSAKSTMDILLRFNHGLGDTVQLTSLIRTLNHYHPDWRISVAAPSGRQSALRGVADAVFVLGREPPTFDTVFDLEWHECNDTYNDVPSTKVERCLREVFNVEPLPSKSDYTIQVGDEARDLAVRYLTSIGCVRGDDNRFNALLLHYEGNTSKDRKDIGIGTAAEICAAATDAGLVPVILDWHRRSKLPDGKAIFCPGTAHWLWRRTGTGDAEQLAALNEVVRLFVGVDSGPQKVALATSTPAICVWTYHHPVHYAPPTSHAIHFLPYQVDHPQFFRKHYRFATYVSEADIAAGVRAVLTGEDPGLAMRAATSPLSSRAYDRRYYDEHRRAGLDYLAFGDWQRLYGVWFVESLGFRGKRVLDIGCACGSILRGFVEAGAVAQGIELNEHMLARARAKWPNLASSLHCCDAVNMHLFRDGSWDAIHCAQVAEHWKPELVPFILIECRRVVRKGGLLWVALDTEELYARQDRRIESEDPTHYCIRSMRWWHEQIEAAGWTICTDEVAPLMRDHSENFFLRYDWDWFCARNESF